MSAHGEHHFVPQFYLRNFGNHDRPKTIATYVLSSGKFVPHAPVAGQAKRHKLYGSLEREQTLSDLESRASVTIRHIINGAPPPRGDSEENIWLAAFVLFQARRTPSEIEKTLASLDATWSLLVASDPKAEAKYRQEKATFEVVLEWSLQHAFETLPYLSDLWCKVLIAPEGSAFITSDNPAIFYNQARERHRPDISGIGLASRGLQIFLPISPKDCLLWYDPTCYAVQGRNLRSARVRVAPLDVERINVLQAAAANDQLYFSGHAAATQLEKLISKAQPHKGTDRPKVDKFERKGAQPGRDVLVWNSRRGLRTGLELSVVRELARAGHYFQREKSMAVFRDSEVVRFLRSMDRQRLRQLNSQLAGDVRVVDPRERDRPVARAGGTCA